MQEYVDLLDVAQSILIGGLVGYTVSNVIAYRTYDLQLRIGRPPEEIGESYKKGPKWHKYYLGPGIYFALKKHKKRHKTA